MVTIERAEVQIFIPVFNDPCLSSAIRSVLAQKNAGVEVLVSDNASNDGTYDEACRLATEDRRVRVYRNDRNLGHTANLNLVAQYVDAPFYMLLCSDDVLLSPDALRLALDAMHSDPEIVSVYCDMHYIDAHGRKLAARRFRPTGYFDARETLRRSIVTRRNLFGIPLLHRREAGLSFSYPNDLNYAGDLLHSAKVAERGRVYHIGRDLIGNRYDGGNLTSSLRFDSNVQFAKIAEFGGVTLTPSERRMAAFNSRWVNLSRGAFLSYAKLRARLRSGGTRPRE